MSTKAKKPEDKIDRQPTDEELVVQEAPDLEQIAIDEPEQPQTPTYVAPLETILQHVWLDKDGNPFKLDQTRQGQFLLRPYYGG